MSKAELSSKDQLFWEKYEQWRAHGFERVNLATLKSNLVPIMENLLSANGFTDVGWLVFDGEELGDVPMPVRTRYMVPVFTEDPPERITVYPGFIVAETLGFARATDIQINLEAPDLSKTAKRAEHVLYSKDEEWANRQPDWWPYDSRATDMTRPQDLI